MERRGEGKRKALYNKTVSTFGIDPSKQVLCLTFLDQRITKNLKASERSQG